jgi:hypothetical protein
MKFILLQGRYQSGKGEDGAPITYTPGQKITSDIDLVKRFGPQMFRRLDQEETEEDKAARHDPTIPAEGQVAAAPAGQVSTGHQFTTTTPDGTPVSGPVKEDITQRATEQESAQQLSHERRSQQQGQAADYQPPKGRIEKSTEGQETAAEEEDTEEDQEPQEAGRKVPAPAQADLNSMSNAQLMAHAAKVGVDLKGAKKREDIIRLLKNHK